MTLTLRLATSADRPAIYRMRHDVYAAELGQHALREDRVLHDALDDENLYVVAERAGDVVGFVSLTTPGAQRFGIEKYLASHELPVQRGPAVWETRILTVAAHERRQHLAHLLMLAALDVMASRGATHVIAMGRREVMPLYREAGLEPTGRVVQSGAVAFEVMVGDLPRLQARATAYRDQSPPALANVSWRLDTAVAPHGGRYFEVHGSALADLTPRPDSVAADVLDAWFDPAPAVMAALQRNAAWMVKTSPPTFSEGVARAVAQARGVRPEELLFGTGSSDLIHLGLRARVKPTHRVLLPDPTYSEYAHVLKGIGCTVERLVLAPGAGFVLDAAQLAQIAAGKYDWIFLVNPNNPTGTHIARHDLEPWLAALPDSTRVWIDETYAEYIGPDASVERFAVTRPNVVVCKSLSKVYALSGLRAGYLCANAGLLARIRNQLPPWSLSMPAQVAVMTAVASHDYYEPKWRATAQLAERMRTDLAALGCTVAPSSTNFLLLRLPERSPNADAVQAFCESHSVFIRTTQGMGSLGDRYIRVAVRDQPDNDRVVQVLALALALPVRPKNQAPMVAPSP